MHVVYMVDKEGFVASERGFFYGRLGVQLSGRMGSPPVPCVTISK
jgi:hypothetical protein